LIFLIPTANSFTVTLLRLMLCKFIGHLQYELAHRPTFVNIKITNIYYNKAISISKAATGNKCTKKLVVHDNVILYHYYQFQLYDTKFQVSIRMMKGL